MTFRAKPVVKRSRPQWESQDRRTFLTNLAFGLVIVAAIVILLIAVAFTWYNEHLAPVGSVDGQTITRDDLNTRMQIEEWRLDETLRRISTQAAAGRLTEEEASSQRSLIEAQRQQLEAVALERIIDNRLQARLAGEEGIAIADADVDAKLLEEATTPETRHAWVIEVEPAVSDGATEPTAAQVADAKRKADTALADLRAGKAWEDVAKTVSTDAATRDQGGDLGWIRAEDASLDAAFVAALFELEPNTPTNVLEGDDGTFRIGRVSEVAAESVDDLYTTKLQNDGVDLAAYREVVRGDVVRDKLEEKIVADVIKPGPQRRVQEVFIQDPQSEVPEGSIKVRHILYSPNDEPSPTTPLPSDDPAWEEAEAEAQDAYDRLQADPDLFDEIARTESDEDVALGPTGTGGKLGGYVAPEDSLVQEFLDAIFADGVEPGDLLEPVRTQFGWHVIQVMYGPPDMAQMEKIKREADAGASFAQLARDYSESDTAGAGGEVGWVARGQLDDQLTVAIFGAEVGETTQIVEVEGDGLYLYKVLEEETRTPQGRQLQQLRATAFNDWYSERKDAAEIVRFGEAA